MQSAPAVGPLSVRLARVGEFAAAFHGLLTAHTSTLGLPLYTFLV